MGYFNNIDIERQQLETNEDFIIFSILTNISYEDFELLISPNFHDSVLIQRNVSKKWKKYINNPSEFLREDLDRFTAFYLFALGKLALLKRNINLG